MKRNIITSVIIALLLLASYPLAISEFYEYIDENGVRIFTDDQSKIPVDRSGQTRVHKERFDDLDEYQKKRLIQLENQQIEKNQRDAQQLAEQYRLKEEAAQKAEQDRQEALEKEKQLNALRTPVQISNNQILVPVNFQSSGSQFTAMLLLDTGANITAIIESVADQLNIDKGIKSAVKVASGAVIRTKTVTVDKVQVGPKTLKTHNVMIFNDKMSHNGIQGLLGQDFLGQFMYTIDYKNSVIQWME